MSNLLISYPKSGRSWLRFALHELGVAEQVVFQHDTFEFNNAAKPAPLYDFNQRLDTYQGHVDRGDRLVYLHRDPRDVMVSMYHQITGRFKDFFAYEGTISELLRDDYFGAHNLKVFQDQWEALCERGLALRVSYEDAHTDFGGVIGAILRHYGISVSDQQIELAGEKASFGNMRKVEQAGEFAQPWLRERQGAPKVRRGIVGGYRDSLSSDDIVYLNAMFELDEFAPESAASAA